MADETVAEVANFELPLGRKANLNAVHDQSGLKKLRLTCEKFVALR